MGRKMKLLKKYQIKSLSRGAISLLLALVVSPMLSIALSLVESARYQDAVSTMKEVIDVSGFSTIADYDEYLDERFNLMSVSQETPFKTAFDGYLDENIKAMGAAVTVNNTTLGGEYPLSDVDVLKQQILEYGEVSIPMEEIFDGMDVEDALDELLESFNMKEIENFANAASDAADVVSDLADLVEDIATLKSKFESLETAQTDARTAYTEFRTAILDYTSAVDRGMSDKMLEVHKSSLNDSEKSEVMSSYAVTSAWNTVTTKKDNYSNKLKDWNDKLSDAADTFSTFYEKTLDISKKMESGKKSGEKAVDGMNKRKNKKSGSDEDDESSSSTKFDSYDYATTIINQILDIINTNGGNDLKDKANRDSTIIGNMRTSLVSFSQGRISLSWSSEDIDKIYMIDESAITVQGGFWKTVWNDLKEDFDNREALDEGEKESLLSLVEVFRSFFELETIYDASLDANINPSLLLSEADPNWTGQKVISCMKDFNSAMDDISTAEGLVGVIKILRGVAKLLKALGEFLLAVVCWVGDTIYSAVDFATGGARESMILYGYGIYNMPNRIDATGSSMTGYDYTKLFQMAGGDLSTYHNAFAGSINSIPEGATGGSSKLFKGAEAEYLIAGSTSEIENQAVVFFDIFMLRFIFSLFTVWHDKDVQTLFPKDVPPNPYVIIAKIILALAEGYIETVLLVNGSEELYLWNTPVYLTPTNMPLLATELTKVSGLSDNVKDAIQNMTKNWAKATGADKQKKAKAKATYKEHLLILMIFSVSNSKYIERLQNLIQLEGKVSHEQDYEFDLSKTYTFVTAEVDYQLNPMFNLDGLSKGRSPFDIKLKQYVGY